MKQIKQTWYYECLDCKWELIPEKIPKFSLMRVRPKCPNCNSDESVIFSQKSMEV